MVTNLHFIVVDSNADRAEEMTQRLERRMPGARVMHAANEAARDAIQGKYPAAIAFDRAQLGAFIDGLAQASDQRIDDLCVEVAGLTSTMSDLTNGVGRLSDRVGEMEESIRPVVKFYEGSPDGSQLIEAAPIRLKRLEESRQWWERNGWELMKWTIAAAVGGLAFAVGKMWDKVFK